MDLPNSWEIAGQAIASPKSRAYLGFGVLMTNSTIPRLALGLALTGGLLSLASAPARAGDDGAAPIWMGITSVFGITDDGSHAQIDYTEHGKLVLPPKMTLPPPGLPKPEANAAWPRDPDVLKQKKAEAEKKEPKYQHVRIGEPLIKPGDRVTMVTQSATAGGQPGVECIKSDAKTGSCQQKYGQTSMNWNPLTWVGLQKKPATTLPPEPDRDFLTDPPKGYRQPVEGVGAVADN